MVKTSLTLLILLILFQNSPQKGNNKFLAELQIDCISESAINPINAIFNESLDCTKRDFNKTVRRLELSGSKYNIFENRSLIFENKWYNEVAVFAEKESRFDNKYLKYLAIAKQELDVIRLTKSGIIIFGGKFGNDKYSIWAWKISNTKEKPKEINLVDLLAGSDSNIEFAAYLKDGSNYENSFIPDLLKSWKVNGYVDNYLSVKAILPQECRPVISNDDKTDLEKYLSSIPKCINESLKASNSIQPNNMLVEYITEKSYKVWNSNNTDPLNIDSFNGDKKINTKWIAWWVIIDAEGCSLYPIGGGKYLQVCDDTIKCISENDIDKENPLSIYDPLELLNTEHQKELCNVLKDSTKYHDSPIKTLIENWADDKAKEFKIISYFNEIVINGKDSLVNQLKVDLDKDFKKHFYLIQTKTENGKHQYHVYRNNDNIPLSTWYTDEIHTYKNPWLGKLALADRDIKVLNIENDVITFKTNYNGDQPHLWSWKIDLNNQDLKPEEYAPLKDLIVAKNDMSIVYSFVKSINDIDDTLKNNIINHFKGNFNKILEFYPEKDHFPNTNYKPLSNLKSADKIIDSSYIYNYLIQKNNKYYNSSSNKEITWYKDLAKYNNNWFARLALTEPNIRIVSFNEANICFVSPNSTGDLWSISTTGTISEKLLIKNSDAFFLTKTNMESYVNGLPENASESEKLFFINSITNENEYEYGDFFFKNERVLFLIKKSSNILQKISDNKTDSIELNLVNNEDKQMISIFNWNQIAAIYKKPWVRKEFEKSVVNNTSESFELWFGKNRLGINKSGRIGLFLSNEFRDFGYVSFEKIKSKNDNIIFKKDNLTLNDFMGTCVRDDWGQTKMWRANPLGLFDRITN